MVSEGMSFKLLRCANIGKTAKLVKMTHIRNNSGWNNSWQKHQKGQNDSKIDQNEPQPKHSIVKQPRPKLSWAKMTVV